MSHKHRAKRTESSSRFKGKMTLPIWKKATWDYLLEHGEITESGVLFVKFHTDGRSQFEGRIYNRAAGYHRGDPTARERALIEAQKPKPVPIDRVKRLEEFLHQPPDPFPLTRWESFKSALVDNPVYKLLVIGDKH